MTARFALVIDGDTQRALLDARKTRGKVRRCHGDLTLRNICLFEGVPTLFDCLEFDDEIATIDVLYDVSFLLMDLWRVGAFGCANLTAGGMMLAPAVLHGQVTLLAQSPELRDQVRLGHAFIAHGDRLILTNP